jgi:hypothetical protein
MRISLFQFTCAALISASSVFAPVSFSSAASLGPNQIINPAAELGAGAPNETSIVLTPGWQTTSNFTQVRYGATSTSSSTGFPNASSPGPSKRGKNFFAGGQSNGLSTATQLISASNLSSTIDGVGLLFSLSGFFGGFDSQNDNAVLNVNFLDASRRSLRQVSVGSVMASDRANRTGLLRREIRGSVPKKTRFISVKLTMTRTDGRYNDGYADNLSLILSRASLARTSSPEVEH